MNPIKTPLTIICFLAISVFSVLAQRIEEVDPFIADFDIPVGGDYKYSYTILENGSKSFDGPFSMIGSEHLEHIPINFLVEGSFDGEYKLTGSHKDNSLHGPIALNAKLTYRLTNGRIDVYSYNLKGNFNVGCPEGNFTVSYKDEIEEYVNVNYNNKGILTGSYHCKGVNESGFLFEYKGNLTTNGKLNGAWLVDKETWQFSNGVKTSGYGGGLDAKAKQYAVGAISEDSLNKENIFVVTDSLDLGYHAWSIILRNDVIKYNMLGHYHFSQSQTVHYKKLQKLATFTETGYRMIKEDILKKEQEEIETLLRRKATTNPLARITKKTLSRNLIDFDTNTGQYYIEIHKNDPYAQFCKGYPEWTPFCKIYLTDEQVEDIYSSLHNLRKEKATSAVFVFTNHDNGLDSTLVASMNYDAKTYKLLQNAYKSKKDYIKLCDRDNNYYIACYYLNCTIYIHKSSWEEIVIKLGHIDDLLVLASEDDAARLNQIKTIQEEEARIKAEEEKKRQEDLRKRQEEEARIKAEEEKKALMDRYKPTLDYILNKKALDLIYSSESERIFNPTGLNSEYWKVEFERLIKPFLPITSYSIENIEIIDSKKSVVDVTCSFTTQMSKKKGNIERLITIRFIGKRILAQSFNEANAVIVKDVENGDGNKDESVVPPSVTKNEVDEQKSHPQKADRDSKRLISSVDISYGYQTRSGNVILKESGYYNYRSVNPLELTYQLGYKFSDRFTLNLGSGISWDMVDLRKTGDVISDIYENKEKYSNIRIPFFLNARMFLTDGKLKPVLSISGGVYAPVWNLLADVGLGCYFGALYIVASCRYMPYPNFEIFESSPGNLLNEHNIRGCYSNSGTLAFAIKIGISF